MSKTAHNKIGSKHICHEIMAFFILSRLVIQTRMHSHPARVRVRARCLIFGRTLRLLPYFMCANSQGSGKTAQMRRLPEPWLVASVISTIISWAGLFYYSRSLLRNCFQYPCYYRNFRGLFYFKVFICFLIGFFILFVIIGQWNNG